MSKAGSYILMFVLIIVRFIVNGFALLFVWNVVLTKVIDLPHLQFFQMAAVSSALSMLFGGQNIEQFYILDSRLDGTSDKVEEYQLRLSASMFTLTVYLVEWFLVFVYYKLGW